VLRVVSGTCFSLKGMRILWTGSDAKVCANCGACFSLKEMRLLWDRL
jgi:hypothetical protein